ncbi:hypothetical protein, partial [Niallia circulans]|uniref:hypothetical protein n=1 Tax=Niallia circulans TaxID=1397 RepID=UPI001C27B4C6
ICTVIFIYGFIVNQNIMSLVFLLIPIIYITRLVLTKNRKSKKLSGTFLKLKESISVIMRSRVEEGKSLLIICYL